MPFSWFLVLPKPFFLIMNRISVENLENVEKYVGKKTKMETKTTPQFRGNFSISSSYHLTPIFAYVKSKPSVEMFYKTFFYTYNDSRLSISSTLLYSLPRPSFFPCPVCNCGNLSCIASSFIRYEMLRALMLPCIFN